MQVRDDPLAAHDLLLQAQAASRAKQARAPGLHLSDLIYCRRRTVYRMARTQLGFPDLETTDPNTLALFLAGQGHHAMLQQGQEGEISATHPMGFGLVDPGQEIQVHATLDIWETSPEFRAAEIKTTRASSSKPIEKMPHYLEQLMGYMVIWRTQLGRLYVLFLVGDYKQNRTPILKCWDIQASPDDLRRWEIELHRRASIVLRALSTGLPPQSEHYRWECDYCPFSEARGGPCQKLERGVGADNGFFAGALA